MTTQQKELTIAIAETLRDVREIPAGHLYAPMMDIISASDFDFIISRLVAVGLVSRSRSHLLTWTGVTEVRS